MIERDARFFYLCKAENVKANLRGVKPRLTSVTKSFILQTVLAGTI